MDACLGREPSIPGTALSLSNGPSLSLYISVFPPTISQLGNSSCVSEAGGSCLASSKAMRTDLPRTRVSGQNTNRQSSGLTLCSVSRVQLEAGVCAQCVLTAQVGTQFKNSLSSLLELLISKEPSYIRCIKPNERKEPSESPALSPELRMGEESRGSWLKNLKATAALSLNMNSCPSQTIGGGWDMAQWVSACLASVRI